MKCILKNKKAFTLVEILTVIIILAILLIIAVPSINNYVEKSKQKTFFASVSNIVNSIKTEKLLQDSDFCMYNYLDDNKNKTDIINSMYVIAHKENDKIIYSVYAKRKEDTIDIDVYDFNTLTMNSVDNWIQEGDNSYSKFTLKLSGMFTGNFDIEQLSKYKICEIG